MKNTLIGNGTYGCVYKPPLQCKYSNKLNEIHKNDIMKVVDITNESTILEDEISNLIRIIDPNQNYFIPLSSDRCLLNPKDIELDKCNNYNSKKNNNFRGIFLTYGGITLEQYLDNNTIDIVTVWYWLIHLCEGIKILHDNNIVHLDIKSKNIVLQQESNQRFLMPKLIDFGISNFASDYTLNDIVGYYSLYPLFLNVLDAPSIYKLYEDYEFLTEFYIKNYVRDSNTDIIKKLYIESKSPDIYFDNVIKSENFNKNAGIFKIDVYMLITLFNDHIKSPNNKKFRKDNLIIFTKLSKIINMGLNIDPNIQSNIYEILDEIYNLNG